jgi:hypothetical protein
LLLAIPLDELVAKQSPENAGVIPPYAIWPATSAAPSGVADEISGDTGAIEAPNGSPSRMLGVQPMGPEDRTVVQLLAELQVDVPFGVETGRIVAAEPNASSGDQKYFAQSGTVQLKITRHQMEALRRNGAPGGDVGVMRSFKNDQNVTFSEQCPGCRRWIHLGRAEGEGQCFCGQNYRVVFDLTPENWSRPQEMRCMDCGVELTVPLAGSRMDPWLPINGHQMQCGGCAQKRLADLASESPPRPGAR